MKDYEFKIIKTTNEAELDNYAVLYDMQEHADEGWRVLSVIPVADFVVGITYEKDYSDD